jgi:hypothetical protein
MARSKIIALGLGNTAFCVGLPWLLYACSSPPPVVSKAVCPPIIGYTEAEQHQAAAEMRYLPPGSEIETMLEDYHTERQMLRACLTPSSSLSP